MPSPIVPLLLLGGAAAAAFASSRKASAAPAVHPAAAVPAGAFDPNLPPDVAQSVASVLATGTDPVKLEQVAAMLATQGYPMAAAALRAKAMMLRAASTASDVTQSVATVLAQPSPIAQPPPPAQTVATANQVAQQAAETAAAAPQAIPPVVQAAQAASTAAQAAASQNPVTALQAAQQATQAAATALSAPAAQQAAQAVQTAQQAVATQNPALAAQAAHEAVTAAQTAVLSTTAATQNAPAPTPPVAVPTIVTLAAAAANEARKGPWKENRDVVRAYQAAEGGTKTTRGKAGLADGMWGTKTALAAMAHLPKVPAPLYWPQAPADAQKAKAEWAALVKAGKVTVGAQMVAPPIGGNVFLG